ncbi:Raf kinase inhibitor-like protein, YbhB/YbcL family (fragment) [Paraburkholderia piptadeniae]|uniref:Raf kinase inhibitor-like protein, YbhB/YbcL family n=1 Tax=Paraburkholderia piptadeniae TaxID=1701573 RepID=A0A1N7STF8_9BURK
MNLTLFSSALRNGDEILKRYTCQGVDVSPPVEWYGMLTNT